MGTGRYGFTGKTLVVDGHTLRQIVCTEVYKKLKIEVGTVGGWIEEESNLSGNAWVYGDAQVYGNAWVSGNAWVYGDARVSGDARDKSPLYIQGPIPWAFYMASFNERRINRVCLNMKTIPYE